MYQNRAGSTYSGIYWYIDGKKYRGLWTGAVSKPNKSQRFFRQTRRPTSFFLSNQDNTTKWVRNLFVTRRRTRCVWNWVDLPQGIRPSGSMESGHHEDPVTRKRFPHYCSIVSGNHRTPVVLPSQRDIDKKFGVFFVANSGYADDLKFFITGVNATLRTSYMQRTSMTPYGMSISPGANLMYTCTQKIFTLKRVSKETYI